MTKAALTRIAEAAFGPAGDSVAAAQLSKPCGGGAFHERVVQRANVISPTCDGDGRQRTLTRRGRARHRLLTQQSRA